MTKVTQEEWDVLRHDFNRSLLIDTSLASLAENIDGCVWPFSGPDETAAAYIEFSYSEVIAHLVSRGCPAKTLDNLVEILRGTMAFDESFGDMAGIASKAEAETDPVKRNLERIDIDPNYPVRLCNFTPGMHDFCAREGLDKLSDFLSFTRSASRQVFISGEFQELLNAISHINEKALSRYLPFRVHSSGLHLVEALAFIVRPLSVEDRVQVAKRVENLSPKSLKWAREFAEYFKEDLSHMRAAIAAGAPLARMSAPLDDLALEPATAAIIGLLLRDSDSVVNTEPEPVNPSEPEVVVPVKAKPPSGFGGFFRRLFGLRN
jgi:hypothetical protein